MAPFSHVIYFQQSVLFSPLYTPKAFCTHVSMSINFVFSLLLQGLACASGQKISEAIREMFSNVFIFISFAAGFL
ncbi:unnamed protein product [Meloidogyne enterolobii]|uniref:Uncharacterized protein n=1 Tax=Meloidogyne enterolobii TaxID=390850 RepID=A0ACB1A946_MELEN